MTDERSAKALEIVEGFLNQAVSTVRGANALEYCANVYGAWEHIKQQLAAKHEHKPDAQ